MKAKHFKNKEAYDKYVAYEHIHHLAKDHGPYPEVYIHGKKHKVKHS